MTKYTNLNNNGLISLVGILPKKLDHDLYCSYNKLTTLKGSPKIIRGWLGCSKNKLTNFLYFPKIIRYIQVTNNNLLSMDYGNFSINIDNLIK